MPTGSGLCSQFGFAAETTVGTPATVTKFLKHVSVGGTGLDPIRVDDEGLGGCAFGITADRTVEVARQASREVELNVGSRRFGLLLKQMMGSAATPTLLAGTVFRQIHNNGDPTGSALTVQFGMPEATAAGVVRAHTLNGCKVTSWELSHAMNQLLKLKLTLDAWNETTATGLATAVYDTQVEPLGWKLLSCKIGGTPSLVSGVVSIAGGLEVLNCKGVAVRGTQPLRTDLFASGGGGLKSEQLLVGYQLFEGDLDLEYASRSQIYDVFAAYTTTAIQMTWLSTVDLGSGQVAKLQVNLPFCKLTSPGGNPMVTGPGTLDGKTSFRAYGDPAAVLPMAQLVYDSLDSAL
jgi:hypothetical protein